MASSYSALLIGVPEYDDPGIPALPFVAQDLTRLGIALENVGYDVRVHDAKQTDPSRIRRAVAQFCSSAQPGQQLLILLSGHGVHRNGKDYLVPASAWLGASDFTEDCLELNFDAQIESSVCGDAIIVVDACREGLHLQEKSFGTSFEWSEGKVTRSAKRAISYVFACGSGERARFVNSPAKSFSVFSQAMSDALFAPDSPAELKAFFAATQRIVDELSSSNNLSAQKHRVRGEPEQIATLHLFEPRRASAGAATSDHIWVTAVRGHALWTLAATDDFAQLVRDATAELVGHWAHSYEQSRAVLADDPWLDDDLARRTAVRLSWLLTHVLNGGKLAAGLAASGKTSAEALSLAEAALLVGFPFLQQAHWAARAADLHTAMAVLGNRSDGAAEPATGSAEAQLHDFAGAYPRLLRRVRKFGTDGSVAGIRWWLLHRWLVRRPDSYQPEQLTALLQPTGWSPVSGAPQHRLLGETFAARRMANTLTAHRLDVRELTATHKEPTRWICKSSPQEQMIRDELLTLLLVTGHRFAIDPLSLPEIITDHLGIADPVNLLDLIDTIRGAEWGGGGRGRTRVLDAECGHPAVEQALREHTVGTSALLARIDTDSLDQAWLSPLDDLPVHATAEGVRAGTTAGGPRYDPGGFRFRLAPDRVQELLMGEQLYGDRSLAIRELYQNALDACRYREARTAYRRAVTGQALPWSGEIKIQQGVDERGRPYIDCIDNGVGMGKVELDQVFSYAGARFTEMPSFIEEQATWKEHGIILYPNSRFGIGVLSYFMLADEITVNTCRLNRDGTLGQRLRVVISGPGAIARIHDDGPGFESGTTVRLHLREDGPTVSCVDLLRRILWISEYAVEVTSGETRLRWLADELSPHAPIGAEDPLQTDVQHPIAHAMPTASSTIWWCDGLGGVLADGLWAGQTAFGAVVNLRGQNAPELTIDRTKLVRPNQDLITSLLHDEVQPLIEIPDPLVTLSWLGGLVTERPDLADAIAREAMAQRLRPWRIGGELCDISETGCFPLDEDLFTTGSRDGRRDVEAPRILAEKTLRWRLVTWADTGLVPPLRTSADEVGARAVPSDQIVLGNTSIYDENVGFAPILVAAHRLNRPPAEIAARLVELGYHPSPGPWPTDITFTDLALISRDIDRFGGWIDRGRPVPIWHIPIAANKLRRPATKLADRLTELGYDVSPGPWPTVTDADQILLSRTVDGTGPWLDPASLVPNWHILAAARHLNQPPDKVAARLTELGHRLEPGHRPATVTDDDIVLIRGLNGISPWLDPHAPISRWHVAVAAHKLRRPATELADRLTELGYHPPVGPWPTVTDDDLILISLGLNRRAPWLDHSSVTSYWHLAAAANKLRRPATELADRLTEFGYHPPVGPWPTVTADDLILISRELTGGTPWLEPANPIPTWHIPAAVALLRRPATELADRLTELGYHPPVGPWPTVTADDLILISHTGGEGPWLGLTDPVPVRHLLTIARELSQPIGEIATRLVNLGYRLPGGLSIEPAAD